MKKVKVVLNHKDEDYKDTSTAVEVGFISQGMIKEYGAVIGQVTMLKSLNEYIQSGPTLIGEVIGRNMQDKDAAKKEIEKLRAKQEEARKEFANLCTDDLFQRRIDLIKKILRANDCENKNMLDDDFWTEFVDPGTVNIFIEDCIKRDKKKESLTKAESI